MKLSIRYKEIKSLTPHKNNPRTHSKKQIEQVANSIKHFGFSNPILVDKNKTIIAGHGRWLAAQELGLEKVPIVQLEHLSDNEIRAYMLADNKLAELADWDSDLLAIEFQHLYEIGFDVEITGFETPEIDFIIDTTEEENRNDPNDEVREPDRKASAIVKKGQIWQLGNHRLYCGNALKAGSYKKLMRKSKAQMVFTDPPYNVPIQGHVSGKGKVQHEEFKMASGEMNIQEFTDFLVKALKRIARRSRDGAISYICMDWRHMAELDAARLKNNYELKNICIWVKNNGGMGSLYRSQHEMVFVLKKGTAPHINNVELGKHGRNRTNVWEYPGVNSFGGNRMEELAMHPTVKPIAMVADAIMDCSKRGGIILDPFGGSGTTLIAAEKTGRRARIIELDPHYCDVIIKRWEKQTGETAKLQGGNNE